MSYQCLDCSQSFLELRNLSNHLWYCTEALCKRKEESEGLSRALKRERYSNSESSPDLDLGLNKGTAVTDLAPEIDVLPAASFTGVSFSGWRQRIPCMLKDYIPHSLVGLPSHLHLARPRPMPPAELEVPSLVSTPDPEPEADVEFTTEPNGFGLYWPYTRKPWADPEDILTLADLADDDMPEQYHSGLAATDAPFSVDFFYPFPNTMVFWYVNWYLGTSGTLSAADLDCLAHDMILSDDFNCEDLWNFSMAWELAWLDKHGSTDVPFAAKDGWKKGLVMLHVPKVKHSYALESASPQFQVSGIHYCPLLEVIKAACQSNQAKQYHWVPFEHVHQSPLVHWQAYTDIYNSDAMLEEDAKIRALGWHPDDNADTEVSVLPLLLWSDLTHLATFGTASLWPVYMYLGNLSKDACRRLSTHAAHHLAYIPSVSFDPNLHLQGGWLLISSLTPSKTFIKRHMKLQQWPRFCDFSRSTSCKKYGFYCLTKHLWMHMLTEHLSLAVIK